MDGLRAFVLGLSQGITDVIPVSSFTHSEIVQELLGGRNFFYHMFVRFLFVGTTLALLVFFRKRIAKTFVEIFKHRNHKLGLNILLSTVPAILAYYLIYPHIEWNGALNNMYIIAASMGILGLIMINLKHLPKAKKIKSEDRLNWKRALGIGVARSVMVFPGASQTALAVIAGKVGGMDSESSFRYALTTNTLVYLAMSVGVFTQGSSLEFLSINWPMVIAGVLVAFVTTLVTLKIVMKYAKRESSIGVFGWYSFVMALVVFVFELCK